MFAKIAHALVLAISIAPILAGLSPYPAAGEPIADVSHIDLTTYPVLPTDLGIAAEVFARGQRLGHDPNALSKIGDCNSADWLFLHAFGEGQYDLGDYTNLQPVIDAFAGSFAIRSLAADNGLNAHAARDPLWANPVFCQLDETPLACEYRLRNPAIALIMFGTNDLLVLTSEQFDASLRLLIDDTLAAGIVPILSTFPRYYYYPDRSILFNQIVVRVALDYDIPLINFWLALESLPQHGLQNDGYHLNGPITRAGDFTSAENLETGYPMRNLITLQTLDRIWRDVIGSDP